jgi:hypothetical protein
MKICVPSHDKYSNMCSPFSSSLLSQLGEHFLGSLLIVAFLQLEVDLEIELEVDLEIELEAASLVASHLKPSSSMDKISHGVQHSCT